MQDGIIAGNGNSRYLKTVAAALSLYPDYESFMAALIAGTFPIDLNGINAGGWTQQGTPLNKANLFSDSTASALGLTASNTPNDALAKIKTLIDNERAYADTKAQVSLVSYIGTGTYGIDNPCSIISTFPIKCAILLGYYTQPDRQYFNFSRYVTPIITSNIGTTYTQGAGLAWNVYSTSIYMYAKVSEDKKTIHWYGNTSPAEQCNFSGQEYYVLVLG